MGKRKVTILDKAVDEVARISWFIEYQGYPNEAKKFVDSAFQFFEKLSNNKVRHRPCGYEVWKLAGYRCAQFRKKYIVAYIDNSDEIIICDFTLQKLLH